MYIRNCAIMEERQRHEYTGKFGTLGERIPKSLCHAQHEFQRTAQAGRTVRHQTGISAGQRQDHT